MDEERFREGGVMLIEANRALIRGSSLLLDGSGPFSFTPGNISAKTNLRRYSDEGFQGEQEHEGLWHERI